MRRPHSRFRQRLAALAWAVAGAASAAPADAGSFRINPVQIAIPADRQAASLTITNSDVAPVSVRVLAFRWSQVDGVDVYAPTSDVITSPPMFTIPAGKTQLVRVGIKARGNSPAYRVVFEEIPRQRPADGQIQVNLRVNLPLYLLPQGGGSSRLSWRTWIDQSGALVAEGRNAGNLHAQVVALGAEQGGRRTSLTRQMGVVLPGSARAWKLGKHSGLSAGETFALIVRSPAGESQTIAVVEQR